MPIRLTQSVKALLIACFFTFLVQQTGDQFFGTQILNLLGLSFAGFIQKFYLWQLFTYSFVHGNVMHLFFNLMMLAFTGSELEALWGKRRFLEYYFFCAFSSGIIYLILMWVTSGGNGLYHPMVGTSGPLYGLLLAYGIFFGDRQMLFMMIFPMKAKHFVWVLASLELLTTVYSSGGPSAGFAQLGGMLAGFIFLWARTAILLAKKHPRRKLRLDKPKKRSSSKHLKLIVNNHEDLDSVDHHSDDNPKTWH